jgi:hypothetical protein
MLLLLHAPLLELLLQLLLLPLPLLLLHVSQRLLLQVPLLLQELVCRPCCCHSGRPSNSRGRLERCCCAAFAALALPHSIRACCIGCWVKGTAHLTPTPTPTTATIVTPIAGL